MIKLRYLFAAGITVGTVIALIAGILFFSNRTSESLAQPEVDTGVVLIGELAVPAGFGFNSPLGVAVDIDGNIYVADGGSHEIKVFSPQGELVYVLGGADYFNYPNAVAAGPGNLLYVGEFREKRIQVIDTEQREIVAVIDEETLGEPVEPLSLAVAFNGLLYVGDRQGAVLVITPEGELLRSIREVDTEPGQLSFPNGVAVDFYGNILVADSGNSRLLLLDEDGTIIREFSGNALHQPRGVSFIGNDAMVVADLFASHIVLFDMEFNALTVVTESGGYKMIPNGIALSGTNLYVADRGGRRVLIFRVRM